MAGVLGRGRFQALLGRCSCSSSSILSSEVLERPVILCSANSRRMSSGVDTEAGKGAAVRHQLESAAREDRLDFFTAARILFSTPAKPKTFGLDFHLWQFFVSLLPPFAVYLTAQYARYEMRRMEKERDEKEQLKLRAAVAEELAAQSTDEVSKKSSTSIPRSDSSALQQEQKDDSKAKNEDEQIVLLPGKDFLAMKARLDAMEVKLKSLESVRSGTTFIIPLETEPNVQREPTKEKIEKPAVQAAAQAEGGEELQRNLEKQKIEISSEVQNQKVLEVSQGSGRSWFGFRSKPKERELSD